MSSNVRIFTHPDYGIDENTSTILEKMAGTEGVVRPIVALPDVHFKYSYHTPTGVVVLSKDRIFPKFVNANCAMSFIKTEFSSGDINENALDSIFGYLQKNISVSMRNAPIISHDDLKHIIKEGAGWAVEKHGIDPSDLMNFENNGSLFKNDKTDITEIMSYVPKACQNIGLFSIGVLGYGNHFIELQVIDDIINKDVAGLFGIKKSQVCFMIHSDSRDFGQSIFDFYSQKAKKLFGAQQIYKKLYYSMFGSSYILRDFLRSVNKNLNRIKSTVYWKVDKWNKKKNFIFEGIDANNEEGRSYLISTYCAINFGYANRAYMASVIQRALQKTFGKDGGCLNILYDGNHDALQKERIDGEEYYVHRNGACRAYPPRYFSGHPVFSKTGQPVLLPSSLGRHSFLCAATKGCAGSYYSTCHGTGRLVDRGAARQIFDAKNVIDEVRGNNVKIYDYGNGYIAEEAPKAFKDVDKILDVISKNNIAEPVARLRPLADLKGWR
ncbi:MAG: RtcB family protein [Candidatus Omnitrophota bacterium]|nr:RtcB family protein [Candidatus Omnitrophota bacterium]